MRRNTLIALTLITIPVCAAAILVPMPGGTKIASVATGPVFPGLKDKIANAAKLTVTGSGGTVTLARKGAAPKPGELPLDGWTLTDKGGYPVDGTTLRPILSALVDLKTVEPKTERPKLYDRLDLGNPGDKGSEAKAVTLGDAGGADLAKLIVGRRRYGLTGNDDGIYMRKPDVAQTWLAAPAFDLPSDTLSWIDRKLVDVDADQIKLVTLAATTAGAKPLTFSRDKAADKLGVQDLPKDFKLKSDNPGSDVAAAFRYLDLTDVEPAAKLTAAPVATAHVETFGGLVLDVMLVDQDGATWVKFAAKGSGDAQKPADEITQRTSGWAYKIPDARVKTLETRLTDLQAPPAPAKGS
ncbi:hypothetical protein GCM10011611_30270 [Aliidongia dinghuensis]|uniref:DUF4340 domain-containing protein n=1 Tax=Aliidongia dinghuensis TaxID=1867774 RepID=A0A8J2YUZ0_9PROT|nr:DUF4340 domain-containing protein [Aliidongia dinghuensis]GGF22149.1 hypothetical protein GCM10011611_30270 [Aliidongia dinghuensis]